MLIALDSQATAAAAKLSFYLQNINLFLALYLAIGHFNIFPYICKFVN